MDKDNKEEIIQEQIDFLEGDFLSLLEKKLAEKMGLDLRDKKDDSVKLNVRVLEDEEKDKTEI